MAKYEVRITLWTDEAVKNSKHIGHCNEEDFQHIYWSFDSLSEAIAAVSPAYINEEAWPFRDALLWAHLEDGKLAALEFYAPMNDEERLSLAQAAKSVSPNLFHLMIYEKGHEKFKGLRFSSEVADPLDAEIPF